MTLETHTEVAFFPAARCGLLHVRAGENTRAAKHLEDARLASLRRRMATGAHQTARLAAASAVIQGLLQQISSCDLAIRGEHVARKHERRLANKAILCPSCKHLKEKKKESWIAVCVCVQATNKQTNE